LVVLVFDPDLLFSSKVAGAVKRISLDCKVISTLSDLVSATPANSQAVILNLDVFGQRYELLDKFSQHGTKLLGYYSHVNVEVDKLAKSKGITSFPRGVFISKLEEVLSGT
jgi:hypothetical protein